MPSRLALAVTLAAACAAPAFAQEAAEPKPLRKLVWDELPSGEAIDKAFPQAALEQGLGGKVVLLCKVLDTGRLDACEAKSETPPGQGFAGAALSLVAGFKVRATTEEGLPTAGGTVRLPIQFSPPQGAVEGADGVSEVSPVEINPSAFTDGRGPAVARPIWVRKPSGEAVSKAFPKKALAKGIGGRVVLSCLVQKTGSVVDCKVVSETPPGIGFGEASIFLSRYFQMKPATADGVPVEGAIVRIPLSFSPPGY